MPYRNPPLHPVQAGILLENRINYHNVILDFINYKTLFYTLFLLIIGLPGFAQKTPHVAKIGNDVISSDEFRKRFELMPFVSGTRNNDSIRVQFLYTLISEKLLAREAETLGYQKQSAFTDIYSPLEKMFARDALFKKEIDDKIKISRDEIQNGVEWSNYTLKVNILASKDSGEIFNLYKRLQNKIPFDSILIKRSDYDTQHSPFTIKWGDMNDESVNDTLFSLVPNHFSAPLKTENGWFIFYLRDKIFSPGKEDKASLESNVKKQLKEKKTAKLALPYMKKIMGDIKVSADTIIFRRLAEKFLEKLVQKDSGTVSAKRQPLLLSDVDFDEIKQDLGTDTLKMIFVPFAKNPASVNDFLNRYNSYQFRLKYTDINSVSQQLNSDLRSFIEQEMLTREAFKQGLNNLPEVRAELKMWKENFLARMYKNSFIRSAKVTDDEVTEYYNTIYKSNQPVKQVKVSIILTSGLDEIENILNDLKQGEDFVQISKKVSKTGIITDTGFVPAARLGNIGSIAADLKPGDVYGPVKTADGYELIKLLDKKETAISKPPSYDDVKDILKMELAYKKSEDTLENKTAELASKYGISVNEKELNDLKLSDIQMFTYRFMGFGGRISAVPYSSPFYLWMNKVKSVKKSLP